MKQSQWFDVLARRYLPMLAMMTVAVAAGERTAVAEDAVANATESGSLETIIVTAQKRAENSQTVPISLSAVTGAAIENAHTINLEALTGAVPNVQIGHFSNTPTGAVFNIRGMGVIEPDPYAGQTVTVVVDGIPQVFNMTSLPDLFDIERIEILRGPQGTLFGANTTGGVVNIVTRQPTGHEGGRAMVSIGNYNRLDANMALDLPITDTLAGKISATHHSERGFATNIVDGSSMGDQNITAVRGYLKWSPNSDFDATLIQEVDQGRNGAPYVVQGGLPGEVEYVAPGTKFPGDVQGQYPSPCLPAGSPCRAPNEYLSANNSVPDKDNYNIYATTLTMNYKSGLGDLTSITGYKRFNEDNYTDQDGTVVWIDDTHRVTHGYQISQELRDTINPTDDMRVIFGGFASYDYYHHLQNFRLEGFPGAHGVRQPSTQDQIRRSYSIFGQGFLKLTDKLRLQAGLRGTREKTRMIADLDTCVNLQYDPQGNVIGVGNAVFTGDTCGLGGFTAKGEDTWNNLGGKIGLDYQATEKLMVYGYIARGFKSGGFTGRLAIPTDIGPYNPEKVTTFEVGMKADWLDNRLRTNLSVFFNKYKDLQLAQIYFTNDTPPKQGNTILNAADAETKGAELEITAVPIARLNINFAVAYLSAKYTKFDFLQPNGSTVDLSGTDLQNAPKVTASAGFNYEVPVGAGFIGFGLQDRYTDSKYFTALLNTPRSKIQAMNYIDANIDWRPSDDSKFDVSFWGRNLTDKRYIASVFDAPGTLGLVNYMPPREYGMTVNYKW